MQNLVKMSLSFWSLIMSFRVNFLGDPFGEGFGEIFIKVQIELVLNGLSIGFKRIPYWWFI